MRVAIDDGSIRDHVQWHGVEEADVILVPAGTIHAIGPGLVIAEIQQSSDATFRLFDHGRRRELHVDHAVAVADAGPTACRSVPRRLTDARTVLVASPHFVLERIELAPKSNWTLHAEHETWMLVLQGHARVGLMNALVGEAMFLDADSASVTVGRNGLKALLAYSGAAPITGLLRELDRPIAVAPLPSMEAQPSWRPAVTP